MNIEVSARERGLNTRLDIVDCDFHPKLTVTPTSGKIGSQIMLIGIPSRSVGTGMACGEAPHAKS